MKDNTHHILEFNPKLTLSKNEKEVLKFLKEAAKLIVPIYQLQENPKFPGANFYPHDATKEEIKKAAEENPQILSPFTVVERVNGKLVATPYHLKYAKLLKPVAEKLNQAAKVTENKDFGKLLTTQAKALVEGDYEKVTISWLKRKPYILDFYISPDDRFDDQLFFVKASYIAWVGVLDVEGTKKLTKYKDLILGVRRKMLMPSERIENNEKVRSKVEDAVIFSGQIAKTKFVGINLPYELNILEKYGSEIILFKQVNDLRMKEQIIPTFKKHFTPVFRSTFSKEDLRRGNMGYIALHELAHSYLHYRNAPKNLQDLYTPIYELAATALGIRMAGSLLLIDLVTTRELESMIVTFLCRSFYLIEKKPITKSMSNYASGGVVFINYMLESGALRALGGVTIPNFMKVFVSLHELSEILEQLLSSGTRKDAEFFIKKYGKLPPLNF